MSQPSGETRASCEAWLESRLLATIASRVARNYRFSASELGDLLQEIRISLWRHGLDRSVNAAWVGRVACRRAAGMVRRAVRARAHDRLSASQEGSADPSKELARLLSVSADRLPAHLKALYELRYRAGLTEREIADQLGICRASVRWLDRACRGAIARGPKK